MPAIYRILILGGLISVALSWVPLALVAKARGTHSRETRIHIIQDMDNQYKFKPQKVNPLFADGRAERPPVDGTVARGELRDDDHYDRGITNGAWATEFPPQITVNQALLERGRERYGIYCAACHGYSGYGNGMVQQRVSEIGPKEPDSVSTWVQPSSLHVEPQLSRPVGHIYNTITNGIRTMNAYGHSVPTADRWAITAYVKALQRSQNAKIDDVPVDQRAKILQPAAAAAPAPEAAK